MMPASPIRPVSSTSSVNAITSKVTEKVRQRADADVKIRIAVISCNRADWSKLYPLVRVLWEKEAEGVRVDVILTGSHLLSEFGKTADSILQVCPDAICMGSQMAGDGVSKMAGSVGVIFMKLPEILENWRHRPNLLVVHGDRYEAFAAASCASMMNIPVAHIEGGELSGTVDGILRHAITKLSMLHCACTPDALRRIRQLGEHPDSMILAGCPSYDNLLEIRDRAQPLYDIYQETWNGSSHAMRVCRDFDFSPNTFLMVMHHPTTLSPEKCVEEYNAILEAIFTLRRWTILFYPNVDPHSKHMISRLHDFQKRNPGHGEWLMVVTTVPVKLHAALMRDCRVFIGNSSAGVRETCVFGTPTLNIGCRQSGRTMPANVYTIENPTAAVLLKEIEARGGHAKTPSLCYGQSRAADKIANFLVGKFVHASDDYDIRQPFVKPFCEPYVYTTIDEAAFAGKNIKALQPKTDSSGIKQKAMAVLGLITARGGSKGIKGKNVIPLNGKPLVTYTVEAALGSRMLDRVIISTDCPQIAAVAAQAGCSVPFMRPAELARDDSPHMDCVRHALEELEKADGYRPDCLLLLQPTSPLRTSADIDCAISKMMECPEANAVIGVTETPAHPVKSWYVESADQVGMMSALLKVRDQKKYLRRQDLPTIYSENGAIYVYRCDAFANFDYSSHHSWPNVLSYIMPKHRSVDIDEPLDLVIAEALLLAAT